LIRIRQVRVIDDQGNQIGIVDSDQARRMGIAVDVMEDVQKYAEAAEFNYPILVGELAIRYAEFESRNAES